MSRRAALNHLRYRAHAAWVLLSRNARPTPGALLRTVFEADSRLAELVGAVLVVFSGIQVLLGHADWPYAVWLQTIPLWLWTGWTFFVAALLFVGVAGAQVVREQAPAVEHAPETVCPYWLLRMWACVTAAMFFFGLSLFISNTAPSVWGGVREAVLGGAAFVLAARHFYSRGVGPYA